MHSAPTIRSLCLFMVATGMLFSFALELARADQMDPTSPSTATKSQPAEFEMDYRIMVTPPAGTKQLRVWLPIPPSNEVQQFESIELSTFPTSVRPEVAAEPKYGNRFAYFEFNEPRGAQVIRHRFRAATHQLTWNVQPEQIEKVVQWPATFNKYLGSDAAIAVNDELRGQLQEILPQPKQEYSDLTTAMRWLNRNMKYDHSQASLQASSTHALTQRTGHCSDYHGLCSAFGRALGYPTRVTYGMAMFPKASPSHCKLEAYLPGYGWVSYDISETQKLLKRIASDEALSDTQRQRFAEAARARLESGFRDNTWLLQTVGTDYQLAPPAAHSVNVVRTIYAEADGQPLPEPDPSDVTKHEFAWMTAQSVKTTKDVPYPFKRMETLEDWIADGS